MQKFSRIDKLVICHSDPHIQVASAASLKKGDVAVAISYSGETKDTYDSIKTAKESGATAISLTKYGQNSISELCDINLFVSAEETTIRSAAMSSRIALLSIVDILFAAVSSRSYDNCKEHLDKASKAMNIKKIKCQPK
jgi:DNA-binding MurR/RpiR family transcriptional regulator